MQRRDFLASSVATATLGGMSARSMATDDESAKQPRAGRLKQSVCRWCYGGIPLDDLCRAAAEMNLQSVELLGEKEWSVPAKHGLTCAVANGPSGISNGWNDLANHDRFVAESERLLPLIAEAGIPSMIVFSGNRRVLSDEQGAANCIAGVRRIMPAAERHGVTVVMELLNSKVDHIDYQCDRTPWGVQVVDGVDSDRFRLLYDIYHMQIMEGDVIRTIRDHGDKIGHYHTGGVPGRREIDQSQELYYPAICRAIVESGYEGYLGQEFIPKGDPLASLKNAFELCNV